MAVEMDSLIVDLAIAIIFLLLGYILARRHYRKIIKALKETDRKATVATRVAEHYLSPEVVERLGLADDE